MNERIQVIEGEYEHIEEGLMYQVLGLAQLTVGLDTSNAIEIGDALSVAGYEETHQVSGNKIKVYRNKTVVKPRILFVKLGDFEAPNKVMVYEQLGEGKQYHKGQLWWRPIENFQQHFRLVKPKSIIAPHSN